MQKLRTPEGGKNLINQRLIELRREHGMSQRALAHSLQLAGYDIDKNVITRIETNKRYVTDMELKACVEIFLFVNYILAYRLLEHRISRDRTTKNFRKQAYVKRISKEVGFSRQLPPVDIHHITYRFKYVI